MPHENRRHGSRETDVKPGRESCCDESSSKQLQYHAARPAVALRPVEHHDAFCRAWTKALAASTPCYCISYIRRAASGVESFERLCAGSQKQPGRLESPPRLGIAPVLHFRNDPKIQEDWRHATTTRFAACGSASRGHHGASRISMEDW